jgi:diacylglycerol kinase (ATP)
MIALIKTEASIQLQLLIALLITVAGFFVDLSKTEWMIQIGMIGLVMSMEGMNTAIEKLADFVHPERHRQIGKIKDLAAGAVFIAAVTAVIVGLIIYVPKLL